MWKSDGWGIVCFLKLNCIRGWVYKEVFFIIDIFSVVLVLLELFRWFKRDNLFWNGDEGGGGVKFWVLF